MRPSRAVLGMGGWVGVVWYWCARQRTGTKHATRRDADATPTARPPAAARAAPTHAHSMPLAKSLTLTASQDGAGDGWIDLHLDSTAASFVGFHIERLFACTHHNTCSDVVVFGGSGGSAEASGLLVSAGHAFVHGVFGSCLSPSCPPVPTPVTGRRELLTTLSVALPASPGLLERVCSESVVLHALAGSQRIASSCAPITLTRGVTGPPHAHNGTRPTAWRRTGVALVKTYKTGSSTLGSLLHRYADTRALDVAVNAKALRHARALEPRLHPGTMPKPTECLYEFHTFKPCGQDWLTSQAKGAAGLTAKPLQLIIDHSRWQPLVELQRRATSTPASSWSLGGGARAASVPRECEAFVQRMQHTAGRAHSLFVGGHTNAASIELSRCVAALADGQKRRGQRLAGPAAYREAVPEGLLVTLMRWPPARFTSAVEQFDIPQQTGVPCRRNRRRSGGKCYGQTCERDFKFTWTCMNKTVHRVGMLATTMRCLMADPNQPAASRASMAKRRIADLEAIAAQRGVPSAHHAAYRALLDRLREDSKRSGAPPGCETADAVGGRKRSRRDVPGSFRFVQESIANTLGWPIEPRPRVDDYERMVTAPSGSGAASGTLLPFAQLALDWVAALARSLDVVLVSEHYDESLLLLAAKLRISPIELVYLSQKRRKQSASVASSTMHAPAAQAALSSLAVGNATAWPEVALLTDPDGPWLWPNELDATLRANWLDSLAYMFFNQSLWSQIQERWPGASGATRLTADLDRFRATRQRVKAGCTQCEGLGASKCLRAASEQTSMPPPHFCWSLRQDTRSWSEHFFRRMALRFDAAAGAAAGDKATETGRFGRRRAAKLATGESAGVTTGNVHWWRCPDRRAIAPRCSRLSSASYSLSQCACSWREGV